VSDGALHFKVNGEPQSLAADASKTLLQVLRDDLELTGSKDGCGSGDCGACVVLVDGRVENSCMILAPQADGADITTVEGLSSKDELHPIQKAFAETWAFQCGFCTPGMLVSCYALLESNADPTREEILRAIAGNFCRCTGYQAVVTAVQQAAAELRGDDNA
jgi:carbon-monoxide dehydrogenase small subunit